MAQRWVTEEEYNQMFENGGDVQQKNPLQQFFEQLPPELQQKIQMLPPEKQQEVLMELMQRNQQASNQSVEQFPLGGLIGRRRGDDNGFDDFMKNAFYDPSGKLFLNQQSYDRYIQFMYPNQQQQAQQPYSFQIPQINIDINKFKPIFKRNHFAEGGSTEDQIPVEAERNETLTTQDGTQPDVDGGYLEQKSYNPISGRATYEIPDNKHNQTHPEGGVSMMLKEGDVVNSDKTKIPTDFKVYGKNFKGKTFKDASDFLSKKEEDTQKQLEELEKEGKADKVTENSVSLMLTKLAVDRNNLNDLQEQVLESKKQKEFNEELISNKKQFGGLIKKLTKSQEEYDKKFDRFLNGYTTERPVVKAESGYKASVEKLKAFTDKIASNPKMSTQDVMSAFKQSGLYRQPSDNTSYNSPMFNPINGSKVVGNFKDILASKETQGYKNPYIAVAGVDEKDASIHSFNDLASKRASTGVGKYQFIWNIHKNDIKKVTGISDPDKFRYSPEAQEAFMNWFRDNKLLPEATKLKQKYQLPLSLEQTMAMIHLEGLAGLEKKIKSGTLNSSTYAGNFKNASPLNYAQGFQHGGKILASKGFNYKNVSDFNQENWDALNKNAQQILGKSFKDPEEYQTFMLDNYPELVREMFHKGFWENTNQGESIPTSVIPFDDEELKHAFLDKRYNRRGFIPKEQKFKTKEDYENFIKNRPFVQQGNSLYYYDPSQSTWIMPDTEDGIVDNTSIENLSPNPSNLNRINALRLANKKQFEDEEVSRAEGKPSSSPKGADILKRMGYGLRESLPYLDNLRLLMEGRIMPTLQQKPYQNPYDNLTTDVNIQSALNDIDRSTLTGIADSTGNPSVRNARVAQLIANAQASKSPLYTQKYNQEKQLENQKTLGQMSYLNQWEDTNRDLRKRYEQEVLQTIENQRQQQHMAINKMMNDYLRKQESDQSRDLALLETNYDWNPYMGKYEFNPEKAKQNFAYKKATFSGKSSNDGIIKIGNNKYVKKKNGNLECIDCDEKSQTTKYGGKIKRK